MQASILIFAAFVLLFCFLVVRYNVSLQRNLENMIDENHRLKEEQDKLRAKITSLLKRKRDLTATGVSKDAVRKELKRIMADLLNDADASKLMGLLEQDKLLHELFSESHSSPRAHEYKLAAEDVEDIIKEIRRKQCV